MKPLALTVALGVLFALQGCERAPVRTTVHAPAQPQAPQAGGAPPREAITMAAPGDAEGVELLARRTLRIPVAGVPASALVDTYSQSRLTHPHEAIDIMAPRGTAVVAVDDGTIVKLFNSKPGGITLYQFDPERRLSYYYAHLDRYAEGLHEGMQVHRGDVLGYVGSTGNADAKAPHLHFAVFKLGPDKHWWEGAPVNPYAALRDAEPASTVTASR